eukprot:6185075-Pleurochrysis_carterae.AAC.3
MSSRSDNCRFGSPLSSAQSLACLCDLALVSGNSLDSQNALHACCDAVQSSHVRRAGAGAATRWDQLSNTPIAVGFAQLKKVDRFETSTHCHHLQKP